MVVSATYESATTRLVAALGDGGNPLKLDLLDRTDPAPWFITYAAADADHAEDANGIVGRLKLHFLSRTDFVRSRSGSNTRDPLSGIIARRSLI